MKPVLAFAFCILLCGLSLRGNGSTAKSIVELPRPNSGTFTFEQAEARRGEILSNRPTPMLHSWKNPYSGFSIHVHRDDSVTVYGSSGLMLVALDDKAKRHRQTADDIKKLADQIPLYGNPGGILISSEVSLKKSKVIHKILKAIHVPSIQIFYVRKKEQVDPRPGPRSPTPAGENATK